MKKRSSITVFFILLLCVFCFSACGPKNSTVTEETYPTVELLELVSIDYLIIPNLSITFSSVEGCEVFQFDGNTIIKRKDPYCSFKMLIPKNLDATKVTTVRPGIWEKCPDFVDKYKRCKTRFFNVYP